MDDFILEIDDTMMPATDGFDDTSLTDTTDVLGTSFHNPFSSGFDAEHPIPSYEELRNVGFSDYVAHNILEGDYHSYSQKELFHVLYESDEPVTAYNDMMAAKAQHAMNKADDLITDIENSGLLGSTVDNMDDMSHYNEQLSTTTLTVDEPELGLADCWPACKALTGDVSNNADWGFHA
jgi:hypothetical protein